MFHKANVHGKPSQFFFLFCSLFISRSGKSYPYCLRINYSVCKFVNPLRSSLFFQSKSFFYFFFHADNFGKFRLFYVFFFSFVLSLLVGTLLSQSFENGVDCNYNVFFFLSFLLLLNLNIDYFRLIRRTLCT